MARPTFNERTHTLADGLKWLANHNINYRKGMTSDQLVKAAQAQAAPGWLLVLLQTFGPILLQLLQQWLTPKSGVPVPGPGGIQTA